MKRDKEMKRTRHEQSCQLWCAILKKKMAGFIHSQHTNTHRPNIRVSFTVHQHQQHVQSKLKNVKGNASHTSPTTRAKRIVTWLLIYSAAYAESMHYGTCSDVSHAGFGTEEGLGPPVEKMWGSLR